MSLSAKMLTQPGRFWSDRRGAFAISFVIISGFLFSLALFGLEGSRFITERARLSDAMEQAALALSSEDNGPGAARNYTLASDYFRAYMRHDISVPQPTVAVLSGRSPDNINLYYVEYRVSGTTIQNSWISSSSLFPGFGKEVTIGDNGAARKYRSNLDVLFVADFSGSMNLPFGNSTKLDELKQIVLQLSSELFAYNIGNRVGFIPFGWGSKEGDNCDFPFKTREYVAPDILLRNGGFYDFSRALDIGATVAAIPGKVDDIHIPLSETFEGSCLLKSYSWKIPLTLDADEIGKIEEMTAEGNTLVSSGILLGVPYLVAGTESRKILVIISDGTDDPGDLDITSNLIRAGMCDKVRQVINTQQSVGKIAFIGIQYQPTEDWSGCVGENNFYLPQNLNELEEALRRAVFEEVGHNVVKDY